ncbi:MAG: hypothetical protein AAF632_28590 [Bacteroidota bacterium]
MAAANCWVKLDQLIPWDELARIYHTTLNAKQGAPAVDARIVIGAMIGKPSSTSGRIPTCITFWV